MNSEIFKMEDEKWRDSNKNYEEYLKKLGQYYSNNVQSGELTLDEIPARMIANTNLYIGDAKLANLIFHVDIYRKVLNLAGDIAEVGIFRGDSFLLWSKLVKIFERYNLTQVYGFDWFQGMKPGESDDIFQEGKYCGDYDHLMHMIKDQNLENISLVFPLDVTKEIKAFIEERPFLRFKILYIDCGIKEVMEAAYEYLYPRLVRGGVLLMDHYNYKVSPTESDIVERFVGDNVIMQMPYTRQPSGYIIKQ